MLSKILTVAAVAIVVLVGPAIVLLGAWMHRRNRPPDGPPRR